MATAAQRGAHLVLASEPNKARAKGPRWFTDVRGDAAIGVVSRAVKVQKWGRGQGFVWVQ